MFILELAFEAAPERLAARPAHRDRLHQLKADGLLLMAGPFTDDSGALLIFDVQDSAALDAIIAADPYYNTPGVTLVRRREWAPVVRRP